MATIGKKSIEEQLQDFINAWNGEKGEIYSYRSKHIGDQNLYALVSKTKRLLNGKKRQVLFIARYHIFNNEDLNQDHVTDFISKAYQINPWYATFVVRVKDRSTTDYLERCGWKKLPNNSFYLENSGN